MVGSSGSVALVYKEGMEVKSTIATAPQAGGFEHVPTFKEIFQTPGTNKDFDEALAKFKQEINSLYE